MNFIIHRVNSIGELKKIPQEFGAEIDLRDRGNRLILQHDPFKDGVDFNEYIKHYSHGTLILNIKSERIEYRILELLRRYRIKDYFFLDSSFPMIHQLIKCGEKNIALRFSEYEKLDSVLALAGKVRWVWVDCFTRLPINKKEYNTFRKYGFRLCLVSPELQGREEDIEKYKAYLKKQNITFDTVCTKIHNVNRWMGI